MERLQLRRVQIRLFFCKMGNSILKKHKTEEWYHEVCGEQTQTEIPIIPMKENIFELKIRSFLDAIKEGGTAPIPSSQILYNQAIIDGVSKSSECGREVEIVISEIELVGNCSNRIGEILQNRR